MCNSQQNTSWVFYERNEHKRFAILSQMHSNFYINIPALLRVYCKSEVFLGGERHIRGFARSPSAAAHKDASDVNWSSA
jgi:hypothetical protein